MDGNVVFEYIAQLPVGVFVRWIVGFLAILSLCCTGTLKLYKVFVKYKEAKEKNEKIKDDVRDHERELVKVNKKIETLSSKMSEIQEILNQQNKRELSKLRYEICEAAQTAIEKGVISKQSFQSLEEMYDDYLNFFHQNGYVKELMDTVHLRVQIVDEITK